MTNATQVKRIRMSAYVEQRLKQLAEDHQCRYHDKASISKFLAEIANGHLEVQKKASIKQRSQNNPLIELEITVLSNLNGAISQVASKLGEIFEVNIYQAKSKENSNTIQLVVLIPAELKNKKNGKKCTLGEVFRELQTINIKNIVNYNHYQKLESLLKSLNLEEEYSRYRNRLISPLSQQNKNNKKSSNDEENLRKYLENNYGNQPIITDINCLIGYQVIIDNTPGTLAKLTQEIAANKFSIVCFQIDISPDEKVNIVNLIIGFYPFETFIENLEKISSVRKLIEQELFQNLQDIVKDQHQISVLDVKD